MNEAEFRYRYDGLMEYAGISAEMADRLYGDVMGGAASVDELVRGL